jgi:aspartate/methionine/tyrosine aminotransferase
MNPQAGELNTILEKLSPAVFSLLSEKGREIYFPKLGILSQTAAAKGKKINATIGEAVEDDGKPMYLPSIKNEIVLDPAKAFPYAPSSGRPDLRERWKEHIYLKNASLKGKTFSLPLITCGLTHGHSIAGYLFADAGDDVFIPDLYWENYDLIYRNAYGAQVKNYRLFDGNKLDLAAFSKIFHSPAGKSPRKKIVLINFPNNPAGYTPTVEEAREMVQILKDAAEQGQSILVLLDDAYFGLVYESGIITESLFSWLVDIHENVLTIKMDAPTKEDYVWGFRVGFMSYGIKGGSAELYSALEAKTTGAIRGNISNAPNISQSLLLQAYNSPTYEKEKAEKFAKLKSRYDLVKKVIAENPKYSSVFKPVPYNSGYFMCVQLVSGLDGEKIRNILLNEFDTGIIHLHGLLRIAFSSVAIDRIPELFENIYKASLKA